MRSVSSSRLILGRIWVNQLMALYRQKVIGEIIKRESRHNDLLSQGLTYFFTQTSSHPNGLRPRGGMLLSS
ncbi:hypothetical protein EVA_06963 [gut metagenome]|uniref:Uncharacterized protein n=1 Tax=gut metagenome TaxID=749906 RepID=J9CXE0_9ZZZZ